MASPDFGTTPLAITVTLSPVFTRTRSSPQQLEQSLNIVRHFIKRLNPSMKISMVCELTKNSDIHYHAIIGDFTGRIVDDVTYYLNNLRKLKEYRSVIGFVCLKACPDPVNWIQYLLKDVDKTTSLLGQSSICNDDFKALLKVGTGQIVFLKY